MKITVCELANEPIELASDWARLVDHVAERCSDLVLLPEMPFYRWLPQSREVDPAEWERSVAAHDQWHRRLGELAPAAVIGTRPAVVGGTRRNVGFVWDAERGLADVHAKYFLPDEPGFWEASWYARGDGSFPVVEAAGARIGFLICTELWFMDCARAYGQSGTQIIVCPRATPSSTAEKWLAGGRAAAVVSGAFCLSSNLARTTSVGGDFAGVGWIAEPEEGEILGVTSSAQPFLTLDVDLSDADRAKSTYPRYVEGPV